MPHSFWFGVAAAFIGANVEEVLHWSALRYQLDRRAHRKLLRQPSYWAIVLVFSLVATVFALLFAEPGSPPRTFFMLGAGARALLIKITDVAQKQSAVTLGAPGPLARYLG